MTFESIEPLGFVLLPAWAISGGGDTCGCGEVRGEMEPGGVYQQLLTETVQQR
jgi:hypothetical protein